MSIYRLVALRNFIRSCGKCTICYETASLQALHDRDYRHGICKTCKAFYNKSECHMCRKSLSPMRIRPALTIDTSMSVEEEALLDTVFGVSEEAMERERDSYLMRVRTDLDYYLNNNDNHENMLRLIRRNCLTFLDFEPINAFNNRRNTMIIDHLNMESLLYIIDESLRFGIRYEQIVGAIMYPTTWINYFDDDTLVTQDPSIITNIIESIFDIEKYVKLICDIRYLPPRSREEMIERIWVSLQNLEGAVELNKNFIDVNHARVIDLQTLYSIFSMEDRTNDAQLISTIWSRARTQ